MEWVILCAPQDLSHTLRTSLDRWNRCCRYLHGRRSFFFFPDGMDSDPRGTCLSDLYPFDLSKIQIFADDGAIHFRKRGYRCILLREQDNETLSPLPCHKVTHRGGHYLESKMVLGEAHSIGVDKLDHDWSNPRKGESQHQLSHIMSKLRAHNKMVVELWVKHSKEDYHVIWMDVMPKLSIVKLSIVAFSLSTRQPLCTTQSKFASRKCGT